MKQITKALRAIRLRLRLSRLYSGLAWGACIAAMLCLVLLVFSFFFPVRHRLLLCGGLMAAGMLLTGLGNALRPVSGMDAARAGDAHGLQERVETALQLADDGAMARLQREDTLQALQRFQASIIPMPRMRRQWLCMGAALLLCCIVLILPNPQDAVIARAEAFEKLMENSAAKAEAEAKKQDTAALTDKQKQETRKLLSDLSRELQRAEKPMDAMLALGEAEKRLEALRDSMAGERMNQLAGAMSAQGMDALAEALESGDEQAMAEALENVDPSALEAMAEQLSGDMQSLMRAAASALQNGSLTSAVGQLSHLSSAAQGLSASQLANLAQLLQNLRGSTSGSGMQGASGQSGAMGGMMGDGQQPGGNGAGRGSTNEDQHADAPDQQGARGNAEPRYQEGKYESIYDPTRLDVSQTELSAQSTKGEGESVQLQLGPSAGSLSGSVPYHQVALTYAAAAAQAADSQNLTQQERQWVTDYFAALTAE